MATATAGGWCQRLLFVKIAIQKILSQGVTFFSVVHVKLHHLTQSAEQLNAQLLFFVLEETFGMFNEASDELPVFAPAPRFRRRKKALRFQQDVDNHRRFGLNEWMQLGLEQDDDVLKAFDDAAIETNATATNGATDANKLTLRRLATQLLPVVVLELLV